jgi:hypothetical protein
LLKYRSFGSEESVVETVSYLEKYFPWIQKMGAAEGETVVQQNATVGDIGCA